MNTIQKQNRSRNRNGDDDMPNYNDEHDDEDADDFMESVMGEYGDEEGDAVEADEDPEAKESQRTADLLRASLKYINGVTTDKIAELTETENQMFDSSFGEDALPIPTIDWEAELAADKAPAVNSRPETTDELESVGFVDDDALPVQRIAW